MLCDDYAEAVGGRSDQQRGWYLSQSDARRLSGKALLYTATRNALFIAITIVILASRHPRNVVLFLKRINQ